MTYSRRRPPSGSALTKTRSATTVPGTHDPLEIKVDCYPHALHRLRHCEGSLRPYVGRIAP